MANLNIRNLPDKTYKKIKELALLNRRSINSQAIYLIMEYFGLHEAPKKTRKRQKKTKA